MKSHELRPGPLRGVHCQGGGRTQRSAINARVERNTLSELALGRPVVVINSRRLFSQCILVTLRLNDPTSVYETYVTTEEWQHRSKGALADLVILCLADSQKQRAEQFELRRALRSLRAIDPEICAVVMAERESPDHIVEAFDLGARGYIPTSTPLEIAACALKLVRAGGIYVPASFVDALSGSRPPATSELFNGRSVSF